MVDWVMTMGSVPDRGPISLHWQTDLTEADGVTLPTVDVLLAAPRGRGLALAIARSLDERINTALHQAARNLGDRRLLDELARTIANIDPSPVSTWTDPLAFTEAMDLTVSNAMGWQEPTRRTSSPATRRSLRHCDRLPRRCWLHPARAGGQSQ